MPVKQVSSTANVTLEIDGEESETAAVMGHSYAYAGKAIFPYRISARWHRKDGDWALSGVDVHGRLTKADGTPGMTSVERQVFGWRSDAWSANTPDWVKDAVLSNTP